MLDLGWNWLLSAAVALYAAPPQSIDTDKLAPFRPVSVRTTAKEATTLDLPGGALGRQYLVIIGTPGQGEKPSVVRIDRNRVDACEKLDAETTEPDAAWVQKNERRRHLMAQ